MFFINKVFVVKKSYRTRNRLLIKVEKQHAQSSNFLENIRQDSLTQLTLKVSDTPKLQYKASVTSNHLQFD